MKQRSEKRLRRPLKVGSGLDNVNYFVRFITGRRPLKVGSGRTNEFETRRSAA